MRNSWVSMGANQNNQVQMLWQIKDEKLVCWLVGVCVGGWRRGNKKFATATAAVFLFIV